MNPSGSFIESISERRQSPTEQRFVLLYAFLALVMVVLIGRSFYLQVVQGSTFRVTAEGNRVGALPLPAPRGIFFDSEGKQLVENIASTDLVLDPTTLPRPEEEGVLIEQLPELVPELRAEDVIAALAEARSRRRTTRLVSALEHDTVLRIEQLQSQLPGVQLLSSLVRRYVLSSEFSHVTGYTSPVTAEELDKRQDITSTDITGKAGLERFYDEVLHGTHGVSYVEVNVGGKPQKQLEQVAPVPGSDLYLTIDAEFQQHIYSLLEAKSDDTPEGEAPVRGAVVALDPRDGAIRALVSYPGYDPNAFSQPALTGQSAEFFSDPLQPLFNRATNGAYAPGSTIKPFVSAAALAEGVITPSTTIQSTGGISIGPWSFPDWKAGGHGTTDVKKAIAESVNTFFYLITGGDETRTGLGVERTIDYLSRFGWGAETGIDLPAEDDGFLPTENWKFEAKGERWYIGDTYHLAIGQGDVLVTPLQLATSSVAVANNGTLWEPHLIASTVQPNGQKESTTPVGHDVAVPLSALRVVREGMRQTVTEGSGRALSDLSIALAGKTGTAQVGGSEDTHAWFTSFGPYESPELVLVVLLERGGAGDRDAVPFAKEIWQWWIERRE